MKFGLVDRVEELESAKRIVAVKAVSLSEEYLAEHFPTFPVLPGVFMLESMAEAARWLVHEAQDFAHSVILLNQAKGITYKSFVAPGHLLRVEVTCRKLSDDASDFAGVGYCGQTEVLKGRFSLTHFNLASRSPGLASADHRILETARQRWTLLNGGDRLGASAAVQTA